eukprot:2746578-Heterocapsa_arctica.AAC.1
MSARSHRAISSVRRTTLRAKNSTLGFQQWAAAVILFLRYTRTIFNVGGTAALSVRSGAATVHPQTGATNGITKLL